MRSGILAFVVGVVFLQTMAALPSPFALLAGGCVSLAAMYWSRNAVSPLRIAIRCAAFFLLGVVWASLCASRYLAHELPKEWEGRDITLIGTIDSLPGLAEQGVRFNFQVEQVMPLDGAMPVVPSRLALAWYSGFGHD
jgi:competence protein ComEC